MISLIKGGMHKYSELTKIIIGIGMKIHREVGPGFQEKIYQNAMMYSLDADGLQVESEKEIDIIYNDTYLGTFRLDLVVDKKVVVELKAVNGEMPKIFQTQIISYLKASNLEVGLLINFGNDSLEVKRLARYHNYNQ